MSKKRIAATIFGIILGLLGLLWFLQGSDVLHIKPMICFANCEPLTGKSLQWQIVGAITFCAGVVIIYKSIKQR